MPVGLKIAEPRLLVSYMLLLTILSAILAAVLAVGYGLYLNVLWIGSGGSTLTPIIVDANARTIYTSRVPLSTYISLSRDGNVGRIIPAVLAISIIKDRLITVRGMYSEDLKLEYGSAILEGLMLKEGGFALVGLKAAEALNLKTGELIYLTSVKSGRTLSFIVSGIYRFGDQRDYEIVVDIELARLLADMPPDSLSIIIAPEANRSYLEDKLKAAFNFTIEYRLGFEATIILADSLGRVYREIEAYSNSIHSIIIPYGYYSIYAEINGKITFMNSTLVNKNTIISLGEPGEKITFRVPLSSKSFLIELKSLDGEVIEPEAILEGCLIYRVGKGIYKLIYGNEIYMLNLFEDSVFTPSPTQPAEYTLKVRVYDNLGRKVGGVILNIMNPEDNRIIYARLLEDGEGSLKLPPGKYRISASNSIVIMEKILELQNDTIIEFKLPALNRGTPSRIISELKRVKAMEGVDYAELSVKALLGLTIEHYAALYLSLIALTIISFIPVNIYYLSSIRERLKLLSMLGFKPKDIVLRAGFPSLLAALTASIAGSQLLNYLWGKLSLGDRILILGYGLQHPAWWLTLLVIVAAVTLWICCFFKELN